MPGIFARRAKRHDTGAGPMLVLCVLRSQAARIICIADKAIAFQKKNLDEIVFGLCAPESIGLSKTAGLAALIRGFCD